ncbi:MAG: Uncharacterized protein Athens101426_134 [Parcubacteria group bacterium Athens1014_26]|nr:MAG: Uncharacterized protein Athens101426_134 [Parcubacteria group bacterium Athens1014_26]
MEEVGSSIVKFQTNHNKISVFSAGFINYFFAVLVFLALIFLRKSFVFSFLSLPTFIIRAFLEIVQAQVTLYALKKADRSTFVFVRNLTIPLILITDFVLGYVVTSFQLAGVGLVIAIIIAVFVFRVASFKGAGYVFFTAVNAVATISLFKYNVNHFNSVEGEQIILYLILLCYFFFAARFFAKENPFLFLKQKIFLGQGFSNAIASMLQTFAISFGNPAIAVTAERAAAVLAGIFSGRSFFKESKFFFKILAGVGLVAGLILLIG